MLALMLTLVAAQASALAPASQLAVEVEGPGQVVLTLDAAGKLAGVKFVASPSSCQCGKGCQCGKPKDSPIQAAVKAETGLTRDSVARAVSAYESLAKQAADANVAVKTWTEFHAAAFANVPTGIAKVRAAVDKELPEALHHGGGPTAADRQKAAGVFSQAAKALAAIKFPDGAP